MNFFRLFVLSCCSTVVVVAQGVEGYGYLGFGRNGDVPVAAIGLSRASMGLVYGGGLEARPWRWFGAGADIGGINAEGPEQALGVLSINGYVHPLSAIARNRWDPFITGGYTRFFRGRSANGGNVGAGLNYWFVPRVALRVELRDHLLPEPANTRQLWTVRFGITIR